MTPPTNIRVLVRTSETTYRIDSVPFRSYVEDVLPNEWFASWDGDALKAGAVAVKSYAWYWVTHYGGYTGTTPSSSSCFDVTDDQDFQVYEQGSGSAASRIVQLVDASWPVVVRTGDQVVQTEYINYLSSASESCGYKAGGTITSRMSQYGTEACNKVDGYNNGYRYNVILKLYYGNSIDLSTTSQLRARHDYQFSGKSTPAVFNAGAWTIDDGYPTKITYGQKGDTPIVTTTGDGFATISVYRPSTSTFYAINPSAHSSRLALRFGNVGDLPAAAQYQGLSAPTQLAVFRPSTGYWYFADAKGSATSGVRYGQKGDLPVPGRWLDANTDSIAIFRPSTSTWWIRGQEGADSVTYGLRGDIPAPADYDGDGRTDIAVYRPSTHTFYVRGFKYIKSGVAGDIPVTGDFTGDGKADFCLYRPSTGVFYIYGGGSRTVAKGTPIGAAPFVG